MPNSRQEEYLSTDPNAGLDEYLSLDPGAGLARPSQRPLDEEPIVEEPTQPEPEESTARKIWNRTWRGLVPISRATSPIAERMMQYGEQGASFPQKAALYGGAWLDLMGKGIEGLTSPGNIALGGLSSIAGTLVKTAAKSTDFANKVRLMQAAKALETPGRVAAGTMIAHGGHRALTGEDTADRLTGVGEMLLGVAGRPFTSRVDVPFMEVLGASRANVPTNRMLPPARSGRQTASSTGPFISGPGGTGRPGTRVRTDLGYKGGPSDITAEAGAQFGVNRGVNKGQLVRQYLEDLRTGTVSKDLKLTDYLAGKRVPDELPIIEGEIIPDVRPEPTGAPPTVIPSTSPETAIQTAPEVTSTRLPFKETEPINPALADLALGGEQGGPLVPTGAGEVIPGAPSGITAKFKFYQPDPSNPQGGFPLYDIVGGPSHGSTVSAETLQQQGIPVPVTPSPEQDVSSPNYTPSEPVTIEAAPLPPGYRGMDQDSITRWQTRWVNNANNNLIASKITTPEGITPPEEPLFSRVSSRQKLPPDVISPVNEELAGRILSSQSQIEPRLNIRSMEQAFLEKGEPTPKPAGEELVVGGVYDKEGRLVAPPQTESAQRPSGPWNLNEPHLARAKVGEGTGIKIGADIKSLGRVLGSSLYAGDIRKVAAKELLQNSIDAIRNFGAQGRIDVEFNDVEGYVQVKDNGLGLTKKELETVFTDLGSSGKREDVEASGGFGLAKAAPLLGGKSVEVTSIARERDGTYLHGFKGTPEELIEGVVINSYKVASNTPTGLTVRTYVPTDASSYEANEFVTSLIENSPAIKGTVNVARRRFNTDTPASRQLTSTIDLKDADIKTLESDSVDVDIIVPKGTNYGPSAGVKYQILNNGMWQGSGQSGWRELPGIPEKILVDIKSKVPEGHPDYPFTANRERLRGSAEVMVDKYLADNIVRPAVGNRMSELLRSYEGMKEVIIPSKGPRKFFVYDVGGRYTPEELESLVNNPVIQDLAAHVSDTIHDTLIAVNNPTWLNNTERVGFIFEESDQGILEGIWIPKPGTANAAILINPFAIMSRNNPLASAIGITHTIVHEVAHGGSDMNPSTPHGESHTQNIAEIYKKVGRSLYDYENKIIETVTSDGTNYSPEVQRILSGYTESRRRTATFNDPLLGTGTKSENVRGGKGKVPPDAGSNRERDVNESIDRLKRFMQSSKFNRAAQNILYSNERSRRAGMMEGVKERGLEGYYKRLGMLKGELPKIPTTPELDNTDVNNLLEYIQGSSLKPYEKMTASSAILRGMSGDTLQDSEYNLLAKVFGEEVGKIMMLYGGMGAFGFSKGDWSNFVNNVINLPKSMKAAFDLSGALRQGLAFIDRAAYWKGFVKMHGFFGSKKFYEATMQAIKDDPEFQYLTDNGLFLADLGKDLTVREEQFLNSWIGKVPGFAGSERAYVGFLNYLRFNVAKSLLADLKAAGETVNPKELTKFVNIFSGRGGLGKYGERIAVPLNALGWSPRNFSSKLTMLNPVYYVKASPFIRKQALRAMLAVAGAGTTMLAIYKMMGAEVSDDPNSSDFGKAKFGNTRVDVWGGLQQNVVGASRIATYLGNAVKLIRGESIDPNEMYRPGSGYNVRTARDVVESLLENKMSPFARFVTSMLDLGKSFEPSGLAGVVPTNRLNKELIQLYTPMMLDDLISLYNDDPSLLPLGIPALYGSSVNTYESKARSPFRLNSNLSAPTAP